MAVESATPSRKASAELIAIAALGVTVLLAVFSQAAWLDGKIERQGNRLEEKIEALRKDVASVDKRLAVVESHVLGVPSVAQLDAETDPQPTP